MEQKVRSRRDVRPFGSDGLLKFLYSRTFRASKLKISVFSSTAIEDVIYV